MGAALTIPTGAAEYTATVTHTWHDPAGSSNTTEGLYVLLPTALGIVLQLTKAEGVYSKTTLLGPFPAGEELRLYVEGDTAKSNLAAIADVAVIVGGYSVVWNDDRPNDTETTITFQVPGGGWTVGFLA